MPRPISQERTGRLLGALSDSIPKMLTLAALAHINKPVGISALHNEILTAQGPEPAWAISRSSIVKFCTGSLYRSRLVDTGGEGFKTIHISRRGRLGVSLAGVLLDWEELHDDTTLQFIIGGGDTARARYPLYEAMLGSLAGKSITEFSRLFPASPQETISRLENLRNAGIITSVKRSSTMPKASSGRPLLTSLHVTKQFKEPLTSFINSCNMFKENPDYRKTMSAHATSLFLEHNRSRANQLMAKALFYSTHGPNYQKDLTEWGELVRSCVPERGIYFKDLVLLIRDESGQFISSAQLNQRLHELEGLGIVNVLKAASTASNRSETNWIQLQTPD